MDRIFLELLNRSLAASWLVLIVLVLRPLLRKAPKNLRCLLWGLAALRLLLPARLKTLYPGGRVCFVSEDRVAPLHLSALETAAKTAGIDTA